MFIRCKESHVFFRSDLGQDAQHHIDVALIVAPCPECPPTNLFPHASVSRVCPFCKWRMHGDMNGKFRCRTGVCWLAGSTVENGSQRAVKAWADVWTSHGNTRVCESGEDAPPAPDTSGRFVKEESEDAEAPDKEQLQAGITLLNMSQDPTTRVADPANSIREAAEILFSMSADDSGTPS